MMLVIISSRARLIRYEACASTPRRTRNSETAMVNPSRRPRSLEIVCLNRVFMAGKGPELELDRDQREIVLQGQRTAQGPDLRNQRIEVHRAACRNSAQQPGKFL